MKFWLISGPLGQALCKLLPFLADVSTAVSVQSLVLIAVDRFGAVVFPLRVPLNCSKLCRFFIVSTWIVAMAIYSPYLFVFDLIEYSGGLVCKGKWTEFFGDSFFKNYFLSVITVIIYMPLVLITILYLTILLKVRSQKIPGEKSVSAREQRAKTERNVLKMCIGIVLVFAMCWLPFTIYFLLIVFPPDSTMIASRGFKCFHFIAHPLAFSNCAINPYICFVFSENDRQGLKNLLSCRNSVDPRANQ